MRLAEFVDPLELEDIAEHKMIWSRTGSKLKLKYRCASGPKAAVPLMLPNGHR
jgi:hypothetical protein